MNKNSTKRLKTAGVDKALVPDSGKKLPFKVKQEAGYTPPPVMPGSKPLPTEERYAALMAADEEYQKEKEYLFRRKELQERREFSDFIKALTGDGIELAMFAYGILRTTSTMYRNVIIDAKAKIWACEYLTDRAFGKATNNVKIDSTIHSTSDDDLIKEIALLRERLGNKVIDIEGKVENVLTDARDIKERDNESGECQQAGLVAIPPALEGVGVSGENETDKGI